MYLMQGVKEVKVFIVNVFEYCPLIDKDKIVKKCPFAAKRNTEIHCGINKLSLIHI